MSTAELKLHLNKLIIETEDVSILKKIKAYITSLTKEKDWWDELSDGEKSAVEESLQEIERGDVVSHEHAKQTSKKIIDKYRK